MPAAARRTVSQVALESLRGAWSHAASARFRGGLTAVMGGALALALASWRADDPSLDASAGGAPGNLLGGVGRQRRRPLHAVAGTGRVDRRRASC